MLAMGNPALLEIKQKATAAAKDYRVVLGYRPAAVFFWKADSSANMEDGVCLDASVDANSSAAHKGALRNNAGTAVNELSDLGSDGITINDDGFTFGQDTAFRTNAVKLLFLVFRTTHPRLVFDLDDVKTYKAPYGKGTQFKADPTHSAPIAIYEV